MIFEYFFIMLYIYHICFHIYVSCDGVVDCSNELDEYEKLCVTTEAPPTTVTMTTTVAEVFFFIYSLAKNTGLQREYIWYFCCLAIHYCSDLWIQLWRWQLSPQKRHDLWWTCTLQQWEGWRRMLCWYIFDVFLFKY